MSAPAQEFAVVTIFPAMFPGPLGHGVMGKAFERGLLRLDVHDLRRWADPPHRQVDDAPFGGGAGMVMKPEPWFRAVDELRAERPGEPSRVILLDPAGRRFDQRVARELRGAGRLILLCGRYEGVDERVREHLVDDELSVGDYVLTGGELAAMIVIEAVGRLVPGVVGEPESLVRESFEERILDHPHYTRPAEWRGYRVPDVLLSGHHARIERWRRDQALARTRERRPDLLGEDDGTAAAHRAAEDSKR
ncbi:MAG: tRNA (guanosine(37)-N1)-methyltransferase TrmD [Acidobacteriota bacterium]|nr:MAG: tRNA (guanosine(37)-N1)-methyltransferase TrmD [Acidobacteriota bacterium]